MKRRWLIFAALTLAVLGAATAWVLALPQFGDRADGERLARMRTNPQYREGAFVNPVPPAERTAADTWMLMQRQFGGDEVRVPPKPLPMQAVAAITLTTALSATPGLRAFWIGHASVYVEIDGLRLLVDPIFSEYASPFNAGPRRFHPPPIALQDLPRIDAVLITHDHYDHLDMRTVQPLAARGTRFFVPLGIGAHLQRWACRRRRSASSRGGKSRCCKACALSARLRATTRAAASTTRTPRCGVHGRCWAPSTVFTSAATPAMPIISAASANAWGRST